MAQLNMLTQKCTHQRVCSLVSFLSIMGSSEMLLSTSTMTSKLQHVKKCLLCRSNERIRNLFITVVSQKRAPWAEHLTSLPKRGVGALSTVSAFNHERVPTSCLQ